MLKEVYDWCVKERWKSSLVNKYASLSIYCMCCRSFLLELYTEQLTESSNIYFIIMYVFISNLYGLFHLIFVQEITFQFASTTVILRFRRFYFAHKSISCIYVCVVYIYIYIFIYIWVKPYIYLHIYIYIYFKRNVCGDTIANYECNKLLLTIPD